jgi:hypothetical protein
MIPRNIYRLLEKSPPNSLAALAVNAFSRGDIAEVERVAAAAISQGPKARRTFFIEQHAMTEAILLWALKLWQAYAQTMTMKAIIVSPDTPPVEILPAEFICRANSANIASLIAAMHQICEANGLNFQDVCSLADVEQMLPDDKAKPIPKLVAEYVEMFSVMGQ